MYEGQGWAESRGALYEVLGIQKLTHIAPDFGEPPETSLTVGRDRPCDSRMFRGQLFVSSEVASRKGRY